MTLRAGGQTFSLRPNQMVKLQRWAEGSPYDTEWLVITDGVPQQPEKPLTIKPSDKRRSLLLDGPCEVGDICDLRKPGDKAHSHAVALLDKSLPPVWRSARHVIDHDLALAIARTRCDAGTNLKFSDMNGNQKALQ